jgi:hypothetical protein
MAIYFDIFLIRGVMMQSRKDLPLWCCPVEISSRSSSKAMSGGVQLALEVVSYDGTALPRTVWIGIEDPDRVSENKGTYSGV